MYSYLVVVKLKYALELLNEVCEKTTQNKQKNEEVQIR